MENQNVFSYTYSPKENQEVLNIRKKYLPQEESKLEELRRLDREVRHAPAVFAYIFGAIATIIMGTGMSLVMTDIGTYLRLPYATVIGIAIGIFGIALAVLTYPIYKGMVGSRKKKYAARILELSDEIMKG